MRLGRLRKEGDGGRPEPSLGHLLGRLAVLEGRVRGAVDRRRAGDPAADDPFRGLYVSDEDVDRLLGEGGTAVQAPSGGELLARVEAIADEAEAAGAPLRLRGLVPSFGLVPLDLELLLVALAPDLDGRFERLYGYLHDDVTRRRASIGLALELAGTSATVAEARHRLAGGPLVEGGLVLVEDADRPFLTRSLRVPDRVAMHLLGDDHLDPALAGVVADSPSFHTGDADALARALAAGCRLSYVREAAGSAGRALATAALESLGAAALALDFSRLDPGEDAAAVARVALREARLTGAGLVAGPVERLVELDVAAVRSFAESSWPTVLTGSRPWDPAWSREVPLVLGLPAPTGPERAGMWRAALDGDVPAELDPAEATAPFRLGPEQVDRAAKAARLQASFDGRPLGADDLRAGARAQNAAGLERLARRIQPRVAWGDLVLPDETVEHLQELADRALHRDRVLDEWSLGGGLGGRGITALFAGESGTGKTMAAEVMAHELGLDLYSIDLATVVDKYVGETEKNLDRIFHEAEGVHGILFFDEADAIFGKRSEVRDAHDRYANVEVAYLLQRMETFDGIAILATNLRANIDEAFARRLDAVVDFPMPDEERRLILWEKSLGPLVPRADDIELDFCARAFELSGGNIRNIALAAAYRAAAGGRAVGMADLIRATKREYRKLGRLCGQSEFGPYYALVAPESGRATSVRAS